ncbi:unnamed protein product [Closterium sp. Naga37s-1]|nr:unnamed protein product [Closterium sp. Naga37s-1]
MAAERVMGTLIDVVKEAVLAAVREELGAHKEEVDELRHMLTAVEERNGVTAAAMEERERELVAVKGELAAVRGELAKHKEQWAESSRASDERQMMQDLKMDIELEISQSEGKKALEVGAY